MDQTEGSVNFEDMAKTDKASQNMFNEVASDSNYTNSLGSKGSGGGGGVPSEFGNCSI